VVLMDMRMPGLDGCEATRRIKAAPGGTATVVIAQTAAVFEAHRHEVMAAGAADILCKPIAEGALFESLRRHAGLEFIHESTTPTESSPVVPLARADLAGLPAILRSAMLDAVASGDAVRLGILLREVDAVNGPLAHSLRALIDDYDYDHLSKLFAPEDSP